MTSVSAASDEGGQPSIFGGSIATAIWQVVIFIVLLVVLGKFAWKPLIEVLSKREDRIRDDLIKAKTERENAERLLADYQKQLADAQVKAEEILKKSIVEAEHGREKILQTAQEQARHSIEQARQQIDLATSHAIKDLYAHSADIASELAAKILQREVNSEDHRVLIEHALKQLEKNN
jgi:F-type H+-transporting ATPase subunit b